MRFHNECNKSGLMRQHLASAQAALVVCDGQAEGAELGSQTLHHTGRGALGRLLLSDRHNGQLSAGAKTVCPR